MKCSSKRLSFLLVLALAAFSIQFASIVPADAASNYAVINTNGSGAGSFAQAVIDANSSPGLDTISFAIPGAGVHKISSFSSMSITDPVTIDGLTQTGSTCGSTLNIVFDVSAIWGQSLTFTAGSSGSTLQGISWQNATMSSSINVFGSNQTLKCNYFNLSDDGTSLVGDGYYPGIIFGATESTVGGPGINDGNRFNGVLSLNTDQQLDDVTFEGNSFGFSADKSTFLGVVSGIFLGGNSARVSNLTIHNNLLQTFSGYGALPYVTDITLTGNKVCVDDDVTTNICSGLYFYQAHIYLWVVTNFKVGGPNLQDRNYFSGVPDVNIIFAVNLVGNTDIQNNYFNLTQDGSALLESGEGDNGIRVSNTSGDVTIDSNHFVSATTPVGNNGGQIDSGTENGEISVTNNTVGTSADGLTTIGHVQSGISASGIDVNVSGNTVRGGITRSSGSSQTVVRVYGLSSQGSAIISENNVTGNEGQPIIVDGTFGHTLIDQNTFDGSTNDSAGLRIDSNVQDIKVTDNIVIGNPSYYVVTAPGGTFTGNTFSSENVDSGGAVAALSINGTQPLLVTGNTLYGSFYGIMATSSVNGTIYGNLIFNNRASSISYDGISEYENDSGDVDAILNHPVARRTLANGENTTLTFEVDLQPGNYRFDVCNNLSGIFVGQYGPVAECQEMVTHEVFHDVVSGVQNLTMELPGLGYQVALLTMTATQILGPSDSDYGRSSIIGAPRGASADLGISIQGGTIAQPNEELIAYSIIGTVCNSGIEEISSFQISSEFVGLDHTGYTTDLGTISPDGLWEGSLSPNNCLSLFPTGNVTGEKLTQLEWDGTIGESILADGFENVDMNDSNDADHGEITIDDAPDLSINSRLLTSGTIAEGSTVSYELEVSNIGDGRYLYDFVGIYFVLPTGSTFSSVTDLDLEDEFNFEGCESMGNIRDMGEAFAAYDGEFLACEFSSSLGHIPSGASYTIQFNLIASAGFGDGNTEVLGVLVAPTEPDTSSFMNEFMNERDGFLLDINNVFHLVYDNNALFVTVNRCEGQEDPTFVDDGCFTVSFSKPIWVPSFTADDLLLIGGGVVSEFENVSDTEWIVHVTGMTPGGTLELLLGSGSVVDLSAVSNGAEVLGQNTIRFGFTGTPPEEAPISNSTTTTTSPNLENPTALTPTIKKSSVPEASNNVVDNSGSNEQAISLTNEKSTSKIIDNLDIPRSIEKKDSGFLILGNFSVTGSNVFDLLILALIMMLIGINFYLISRNRKKSNEPIN